jgi:hypothetical protein
MRVFLGELCEGVLGFLEPGADARVRALQPGPQRFGQRRRDNHGSGRAAGKQDLSFGAVQPALRRLRRADGLHLVNDVGIGIIDRHMPVAVGVGLAGTQTLDQAAVNTDPAGTAASVGSPSKEYSVALEAVSTTRPRPWPRKRSPRARSASPLAP